MNIGSASSDTGFVILGALAMLVVLPLALALIGQSARLVAWLFRTQANAFYIAWWSVWIVAIFVGTSLYLDNSAARVTSTVTEKTESIKLQREGGWGSRLQATLEYPYADETGAVMMYLSASDFDALQKGGTAELELAPLYHTIALVRLASINTLEWLATPLRWLALIVLAIFLIWRVHFIKSKRAWIAIFVVGLLIAIVVPVYLTYHAWQSAEDVAGRPLRAEATVTALNRITNIDYFPCESDCSDTFDTAFDVPQQYNIVQMTFLPEGHHEAVLAADSADAGSIVTFVGDILPIAYAADDPRNVQILDVTHSHYWRNAMFFVWTTVLTVVGLFALRFAVYWMIEKVGKGMRGRLTQ